MAKQHSKQEQGKHHISRHTSVRVFESEMTWKERKLINLISIMSVSASEMHLVVLTSA